MPKNEQHIGNRVLAIDAGSTTIRTRWYERNGHLTEISFDEFNNPISIVHDTNIIQPQAWDALAQTLRQMGEKADAIVVTGALKNPAHFRNENGDYHQILGKFDPHLNGEEVMEAVRAACGHYPQPGQEHYGAIKCGVRLHDPFWQKELGKPKHVGSRIGAFTAAALGMIDAFIAEPDYPGFTLNGGSLDNLSRAMKSFQLEYEARPQKFTFNRIEVYTAGDVSENSKLYLWLIQQGLIERDANIFEGDTYLKRLWLDGDQIKYQKEAMGASINPFQIPWFRSFMDQEQIKQNDNYPYWFVSNQAAQAMNRVNQSPYYLLYRDGLVLVTENGNGYRRVGPNEMPNDLDVLSLIAASNFVSVAANATKTARQNDSGYWHAYSGMYRENQPAALLALTGVASENTDVYLDKTPDSAGVAVINSCIEDGQQIDPRQFIQIIPLDRRTYPRNRFAPYVARWEHADATFQIE